MNTISQIFPKTGRISGREVGDGAKPDVPTTDRQNEKKTRNFQKFSSDDGNESLQYNPPLILPSLPHWIQHTRIRDENRDFRKSGKPNENRRAHASHDVLWPI